MPKYHVYAKVVGSKYMGEFIASDPDDAIQQALDKDGVSLCHHCSREVEDAEIDECTAEEIVK